MVSHAFDTLTSMSATARLQRAQEHSQPQIKVPTAWRQASQLQPVMFDTVFIAVQL